MESSDCAVAPHGAVAAVTVLAADITLSTNNNTLRVCRVVLQWLWGLEGHCSVSRRWRVCGGQCTVPSQQDFHPAQRCSNRLAGGQVLRGGGEQSASALWGFMRVDSPSLAGRM
jgi:hypothetical protein